VESSIRPKAVWPYREPAAKESLQHQDWMYRIDLRLAPHRVEVPRAWRKATTAGYYFPKDCFPRAIQFVRLSPHLPDALYVLGKAVCGGLQQHGWVEIGDVVFDGVMQEFYSKQGYYQSELAEPWYRFTRKATMWIDRMNRRQEEWSYRWDCVLGLPRANFANPELIDLEAAKRYWYVAQKRFNKKGK
jgi:hypothetical protein